MPARASAKESSSRQRPTPAMYDEIERRLARAGLRWTAGRRAVVDAMHSFAAPVAVPDLQARVRDAVPLSSLYRIIGDLVTARVLIKLEFAEGFARYEFDEELAEHHHHLVCTECGAVADVDIADVEHALAGTNEVISRRTGFRVASHRLDFFGVCRSCA